MSLQVWLPLTNDIRNQGLCGSSTTNNNSVTYSSTGGKLGGCYTFNGSNSISIPKVVLPSNTTNWSFACWFKLANTTSTSAACLFSERTGGNANGYTIFIYPSSSNVLVDDGTRWTIKPMTFAASTWYHFVVTRSASGKKIYVNGVELSSTSTVGTTTAINNNGCLIGLAQSSTALVTGNQGWIGDLNDVRIYNNCLSVEEVKELSKGLVLHYPLNRNGWGQENIVANSQVNGSWGYSSSGYDHYAPTTLIVPSASQYTLSFDAKSTVAGDKLRTHYYSPNTTTTCVSNQGITKTATDGNMDFTLTTNWRRYWVTYTQTETTAVKHVICPRLMTSMGGTGTVSVRNVKFEEGTKATPWSPASSDALATTLNINGNIEYDISGYCHNGTKTGTFTYKSDTPKYDVSTTLGNNSTKIHISGLATTGFANSYSFAWWGKTSTWSNMMQWGFSDGVRLNGIYNGTLWNTGDGSNNPLYTPGTTTQVSAPTTNVWHHFVMVGDGSTCKVYQDGVLWAQAKTYKTISGTSIYLNGWDSGTSYSHANGYSMSDFRIYATALSADDVAELYAQHR